MRGISFIVKGFARKKGRNWLDRTFMISVLQPLDGGVLSPQETTEQARVSGLPDVSREELKKWYGVMQLARVLDDKAPNYLKQGLGWSYHAPCAGHDAIQLALGMTYRTGRDYPSPSH